MIKTTIYNDGKGKQESWKAGLFESLVDEMHLEGYGSTKEEAIDILKKQVEKKIKLLQSICFDNPLLVDHIGYVLKEKHILS